MSSDSYDIIFLKQGPSLQGNRKYGTGIANIWFLAI